MAHKNMNFETTAYFLSTVRNIEKDLKIYFTDLKYSSVEFSGQLQNCVLQYKSKYLWIFISLVVMNYIIAFTQESPGLLSAATLSLEITS